MKCRILTASSKLIQAQFYRRFLITNRKDIWYQLLIEIYEKFTALYQNLANLNRFGENKYPHLFDSISIKTN